MPADGSAHALSPTLAEPTESAIVPQPASPPFTPPPTAEKPLPMPIATDAVPAISPVEEPRPVAPASDSQPLPTSIEPVATDTPGELPTVDPRDDLFTESPIVEKPVTEEPAPEIATEPEPAVLPLEKKTDKKTDEAVDEEENLFDDVPEASIDDELSSPAAARPVDAKPALDEPGAPEEDLFAEPANKTDCESVAP